MFLTRPPQDGRYKGALAMRHIHLEDQLRIRFPGRSADFDEGVEVGMIAALMALKVPNVSRWIAASTGSQIRSLAEKFGYRVIIDEDGADWWHVTLTNAKARPQLRVVRNQDCG
jgi:hypothetical protein